jgi:hypothetical protein
MKMSGRRMGRAVMVTAMAGVTLIVAGARVADAGPSYSLGRKAVCAEKAVEVELVFARSTANDRLVERAVTGRRTFPSQLQEHALAGARVTTQFYPGPPAAPALPRPLNFYLPDRVWRAGYERGHLRALLFVGRLKGKPEVLFGVEGVPTDADADYPEVRAAVAQYARWRAKPDDVAAISQAEGTLASTTNPAVATLASSFLCAARHPDAVARAVRSAAPSSGVARTSVAAIGTCPAPAESCSDW